MQKFIYIALICGVITGAGIFSSTSNLSSTICADSIKYSRNYLCCCNTS